MLMSGSALAKTLKKTRGRAVEIYLQKAVTNANISPSDFRFREFSVLFFFFFGTLVALSHRFYEYACQARARKPVNGEINPLMCGHTRYRAEVYSSITKVHAQMHSINLKPCP